MALRHTNPTQPRRDRTGQTFTARAPYNFVPLPEKMVPAPELPVQDQYEPGRLTGRVACTLETRSPLYVRGMLEPKEFSDFGEKSSSELSAAEKERRADFFSSSPDEIEGHPTPAIPGSSLRGMVRTLVEIIGAGRLRWVGKEPTFTFRAVAASRDDPLREPYREVIGPFGRNVYAGYLVRREEREGEVWYIQPAQRPRQVGWPSDEAFLKVKEGSINGQDLPRFIRFDSPDYRPQIHRIHFDVDVRRGKRGSYVAITRLAARTKKDEGKYQHEGFLVTSGNMKESAQGNRAQSSPRKKHALVLLPDERARTLRIPQQVIDDYLAGLTDYQKEMLKDWNEKCEERGCLGDLKPVFYVAEGNEVIAFGHSPNFRIAARLEGGNHAATPPDFVPEALRNDSRPDLADALFGWVEDNDLSTKQRSGRVFFEDARFLSAADGVWLRPKPITPHVLSSPKATTFQHYLVQDKNAGHNPDRKESLAHYGSSPSSTELRGYKLYWHRGATPSIEASATEREHEKQLTRILPVRPGVRFQFNIHFENLLPAELGALWWALSLPGEPGKTYYHKLGMGKPLGMGAVALQPQLYLSNRSKTSAGEASGRYARLFDKNDWHRAEEEVEGTPYAAEFESFMRQALGLGGVDRLAKVERIQMLLAMLEWREGVQEWLKLTSYMEIEAGSNKVNEYKERPVLPDPLAVSTHYRSGERNDSEQLPRAHNAAAAVAPTPSKAPVKDSPTATGRVKRWVTAKGYGFIVPDTGGKDLFVHISDVEGKQPLSEGQRVQFESKRGPRGLQAVNVHPM